MTIDANLITGAEIGFAAGFTVWPVIAIMFLFFLGRR